MKGKIIQLQVISVPNTYDTQCYAFMYALTDWGYIYFKTEKNKEWIIEYDPDEKQHGK